MTRWVAAFHCIDLHTAAIYAVLSFAAPRTFQQLCLSIAFQPRGEHLYALTPNSTRMFDLAIDPADGIIDLRCLTAEANLNYLIRKPGATLERGQPQSQWSATQSSWVYKDSLVLSFTCTHLSLLLSCSRLHSLSFSLRPFIHLGSGHRLLLGTSFEVTGTGDASGLSEILGSGGCSLAVVFRCRLRAVSPSSLGYLSVPSLTRVLANFPSTYLAFNINWQLPSRSWVALLPPTFDTLASLDCTVAGPTYNWGRRLCLLHSRRLALVPGFYPQLQQLSRRV